ncbi:MAG: hypothetical protein HYZ26_09635 [Chloroflexi bacterium]|nr:hypothetical protein [Chloroflexota bacterium]
MIRDRAVLALLAGSAIADWILNRVVSRVGIFIPKTPLMIQVYDLAGTVGRFAGLLTALLAIGFLGGLAVNSWLKRQFALAAALSLVSLLSLWFLFAAPVGWAPMLAHGLSILVVAVFAVRLISLRRLGFALLAASAVMGELYLALPGMYQVFRLAGPPPASIALFAAGEALAVAGAIAFAWECRKAASRRNKAAAMAAAAAFAVAFAANPSLTGILTIWATGYSLYLPAFLYVLAVYGLALALLASAAKGREQTVALALIVAGGFAPQLSPQRMLALASFWLASQNDAAYAAPAEEAQLAAPVAGGEVEPRGAV